MSYLLVLPDLPNGYVRRRDYEETIESRLARKPKALILCNKSGSSSDTASGKTVLLLRCLKNLTKTGVLKSVLWISFGRYQCELPQTHVLLVSIANVLRTTFSKQLGTFGCASHLHGCSVHDVQQYIRLLMSAVRHGASREKSCDAEDVVLVLDECTRAIHISAFAHLGIRVVVTTRDRSLGEYLTENDSEAFLEIGGMALEPLRQLATRTCNLPSVLSDVSLAPLKRISANLRCCCMLSSIMKATEPAFNTTLVEEALDTESGGLIRRCLGIMMDHTRASERVQYGQLLLLPHRELIPLELVARLWKKKLEPTRVQAQAFCVRGLLTMSANGNAISIPFDLMMAMAKLTMSDAAPYANDLAAPVRVEAALAMQLHVTDKAILQRNDFQHIHASAHVACWEHLLQLHHDRFLGGVCERSSPQALCSPLIRDFREAGEYTALANLMSVLLAINEDAYSHNHGDRAWGPVRDWLFDEIFNALEKGMGSDEYLAFALGLVPHDSEKAAACLDLSLRAFAENIDSDDARPLLRISDTFFLMAKCQQKSGHLESARNSLTSASGALRDALIVGSDEEAVSNVELHPDVVTLNLAEIALITEMGGIKESRRAIQSAIAASQAEGVHEYVNKELISTYCFCLGEALIQQKSFTKARKAHEESLAVKLEVYGPNHPATAASFINLGMCCLSCGQHDKALSMFQKAIDTHAILFGLDHPALRPVIESSTVCLKHLYGETNEEVIQYLRMVLKEIMAAERISTTGTLSIGLFHRSDQLDVPSEALWQLSDIYMHLNDEKSAKAYAKKALEMVGRHRHHPIFHYFDYGESRYQHRQIGRAYCQLGHVHQTRKRYIKAGESYQSALLHYLQGGAATETYAALSNDLQVTLRANQFNEDADIFHYVLLHVLPDVEKDDRPDASLLAAKKDGHLSTWATLRSIATVLQEQGESEKADFVYNLLNESTADETKEAESEPKVDLASDTVAAIATAIDEEKEVAPEDAPLEKLDEEDTIKIAETHVAVADEANTDSHPVEDDTSAVVGTDAADSVNDLFTAVLAGDEKTVEALLSTGVDVNTQSELDGSTPLLVAALTESVSLANLLLEHGANPMISDNDGTTPLLVACFNGCNELYTLLAPTESSWGAESLRWRDKDGQSPLLIACKGGHTAIVRNLLERECVNINQVDNLGNTPLIVAVAGRHHEVSSLLISTEGIQVDLSNRFGDTPLIISTMCGNISLTRMLLHHGASKVESNADGVTVADISIWNNDEAMFQLIMEEDERATQIQAAWRMFRVRSTLGRKVDQHIVRALQSAWSARHLGSIIKVQTRMRIYRDKKELQRRLMDSVQEHVRGYALLKIAAVLMLHFHRYVKDFRTRKGIRDRMHSYGIVPPQTPQKTTNSKENRVPGVVSPRAMKVSAAFNRAAANTEIIQSQSTAFDSNLSTNLLTMMAQPILPSWNQIKDKIKDSPQDPRTLSSSGEYPLQLALRLGMDDEIIMGLLNAFRGAASNANQMGNTALHAFCSNCVNFDRKTDILNALLEADEEAAQKSNKLGELPLHSLAASLHFCDDADKAPTKMINKLVSIFSQAAHITNGRGDLALHLALQRNVAPDVITRLLDAYPAAIHTASGNNRFPVRIAVQNNCSLAVIRVLLAASEGNINVTEGTGTAIHMAIRHKANPEIIAELVRSDPGALTTIDNTGVVPLHVALKSYPDARVVRILLEGCEQSAIIKCHGAYPLQIALDRNVAPAILQSVAEAHPYSDDLKTKALEVLEGSATTTTGIFQNDSMNTFTEGLHKLPNKSYVAEKEKREKIIAQKKIERAERQLKADQERAVRQAQSALKREQAAKERAERMTVTREERRQQALDQLKVIEEETIAKRQAAIDAVTQEADAATAGRAREVSKIESIRDNARNIRLEKWKKVVAQEVPGIANVKKEAVSVDDAATASDGESKVEELHSSLKGWERPIYSGQPNSPKREAAATNAAKFSAKKSYTPQLKARQQGQKVPITPMGITLALGSILHDNSDDSDDGRYFDRDDDSI
jgi:ankyrin repeat protein/tetratricopeptide (TPR) repeat protein